MAKDFEMDLSGLSDEERLALEGEDEDTETPVEDAFGEDAEDAETPETPETPADEDEGPESAPAAPAAEPPAAAPAEDPQPEPAVDPKPEPRDEEFRAQVSVPQDFAARAEQVETDLAELGRKWEEGELDSAEYHKQMVRLSKEQAVVVAQAERIRAEQEAAGQRWNWEVESFLETNKEFAKPILFGALKTALEGLYGDQANSGRSYRWFLSEAAGAVRTELGLLTPAAPAAPPAPAKPAAPARPAKPKPSDLPQTLAQVPAAAEADVGQDQFAGLDRLSGAALEAALLRMSAAQVDEYLDTRRIHA